jgi:hypothetical protein
MADYAVACYCGFGSVWIFMEQTAKLFRIEAFAAKMADSPMGPFGWGFGWSDTLILGPFLLIGGRLLLSRRTRIPGHLIAFSGFAINLYASVFISVGYWAGGKPLGSWQTFILLFTASLGAVCMVYSASVLLHRNRTAVNHP